VCLPLHPKAKPLYFYSFLRPNKAAKRKAIFEKTNTFKSYPRFVLCYENIQKEASEALGQRKKGPPVHFHPKAG